MDLRIYFKHMDTSPALADYASQKVRERIGKYAIKATSVRVTIAVANGLYYATCHLSAPGGIALEAEASDELSMYSAVDQLADKLETQLRRRKEKLRSHRDRGDLSEAEPELAEGLAE